MFLYCNIEHDERSLIAYHTQDEGLQNEIYYGIIESFSEASEEDIIMDGRLQMQEDVMVLELEFRYDITKDNIVALCTAFEMDQGAYEITEERWIEAMM